MPRVVCPMCRTGFEASINRENFALNCVSCGVAFSAASFLWKDDSTAQSNIAAAAAASAMANASPAKGSTMLASPAPATASASKNAPAIPAKPTPAPAPAAAPSPVASTGKSETRPSEEAAPVGALEDAANASVSSAERLSINLNEPCPRFVPLPAKKAAAAIAEPVYAKPAAHQTRTGGLPFMVETETEEEAKAASVLELASVVAAFNGDRRKESTNLQALRDKLNNIRVKLSEGVSRKELAESKLGKSAIENSTEIKLDQSADECPTPAPVMEKSALKMLPKPAPEASVAPESPAKTPVKEKEKEQEKAVEPVKAALPIEMPKHETTTDEPKLEKEQEKESEKKSAALIKIIKEEPRPKAPEEKVKKKARRPLLEGSFGPYDIEGEIARGGVGAVFRARERASGREVALKVLLDGEEAGETERERFRHECETAKALSLPGMVQVFEVGELEQRPYMAMELVNGRSLDKVIPEKSLSVNDCLVLMKSVAETIAALHEAGYVHRDLKPGNILIDAFGTPKVADFGLVKSLDEITRMTASGLVCGTPAYMSPEQARGDGKAIDPRSDVWALGAVLYEMLTARPPFQAENALRLMLKITKDQPKPPRMINLKVPQDVHFIVMKCLEKNADKRYATARAMAIDIGRFLNGEPLEMRSQPKLQQLYTAVADNRRRMVSLAIAVSLVLVVGVLARKFLAPRDPAALVEQGARALSDPDLKGNERIDVAERYFRDAIALDAKNAKGYRLLGLCLGRRGIDTQGKIVDPAKLAEARSATLKAAELDPQMYGDCRAQLARFALWTKQPAEEAREWEKAVEFSPGNLKYRVALAMAYWNTGALFNSNQYYNRALIEFKGVAKVDPAYPRLGEYIQQLQERFLSQPTVADSPPLPVAGRRR